MTPLPIVYSGIRQPTIDIVSIPGLPDLVPLYRVKDHDDWLRKTLSHHAPYARIMSFHYDFAKTSQTNASWKELTNQVIGFLYALTHRRAESKVTNRPIVFICYSFGSLILKKALLTAARMEIFHQIFENTTGIMFLGSLHNEKHEEFEALSLKCAAVEFKTTDRKTARDIIETLRTSNDWPEIKEVMEQFRELNLHNTAVCSFCELCPSVYQSRAAFRQQKSDIVCPESLAKLGWRHEEVLPINLDHVQLSTFPRRDDSFFDTFKEHLTQICRPHFTSADYELADMAKNDIENDLVFVNLSTLPDNTVELYGSNVPYNQEQPAVRLPLFVVTPHKLNADFIGREEILAKMHTMLQPSAHSSLSKQQKFAICGLGGMGKTQIAIKYVFDHRDDYDAILWAHGESKIKLVESFSRFAEALAISVAGIDQTQAVKEWLQQTEATWLLVFDNADSDDKHELLRDFLPESDHGSILITSRDINLLGQCEGRELNELDSDSAVDLLIAMSRFKMNSLSEREQMDEMSAARTIAKRIGFLPLGIQHAANFIMNERIRMTEFVKNYDNEDLIKEIESVRLVWGNTQSYQHTLSTVWNMNFTRLEPDQQRLLNVMAFCDPDRFHLRILSKVSETKADPMTAFISTERKIHKCKQGILRSSLARENASTLPLADDGDGNIGVSTMGGSNTEDLRELNMHRLVQASCLVRMGHDDSRQLHFKIALSLIKRSWPVSSREAVHNPKLWPEQHAFLPHVQALCNHYTKSCRETETEPLIPEDEVNWEFPTLLYEAGWYCYERGILGSVNDLLLPAKEYCMMHKNSGGNKLLADIYGGLGSLATETNQFKSAYDNFQAQWECIHRAIYADELQRPTIWEIFGIGRLGNGFHGLHRYPEAETKYRELIAAWNDAGLPGDRKLWVSHLGTCLWLQGKLEEAEATINGVLKDRNDVTNFSLVSYSDVDETDNDMKRTGLALFSLGNIETAQAERLAQNQFDKASELKFDQAQATHTQALVNYQTVLGKNHHKTADAFHKCAWHFHRRRDYVTAKMYLERALEVYKTERIFFKNEISRSTYKLGCVLQDMGEMLEGREKIVEAERLRKDIVPPEDWAPATGEEDFDEIVMFWTR